MGEFFLSFFPAFFIYLFIYFFLLHHLPDDVTARFCPSFLFLLISFFLFLGDTFNSPLDCLPSKLSFLQVGKNFTHNLHHLPDDVTELIVCGNVSLPYLPRHCKVSQQQFGAHDKFDTEDYLIWNSIR